MKKSKLTSIILAGTTFLGSLAYSQKANAFPDRDLVQKDKQLHFEAGAIIGGISYFLGPALEKAIFGKSNIAPYVHSLVDTAIIAGLKEEVYDKYHLGENNILGKYIPVSNKPDIEDFFFTLAGGLVSGVTLNVLENLFKIGKDKFSSVNFGMNPKNKDFYFSYTRNFSFD